MSTFPSSFRPFLLNNLGKRKERKEGEVEMERKKSPFNEYLLKVSLCQALSQARAVNMETGNSCPLGITFWCQSQIKYNVLLVKSLPINTTMVFLNGLF